MLKDRGNKKWTSLMLVEHRKGLEEILEHEEDVDMPVLDEQKIEELERALREAIEKDKDIEVTYYNQRRHKKISGSVKIKDNSIIVADKTTPLQHIIDIKIKL